MARGRAWIPAFKLEAALTTSGRGGAEDFRPVYLMNIFGALMCEILVNRVVAKCVLDTGSGVSIIREDFVNKNKWNLIKWEGPDIGMVTGDIARLDKGCRVLIEILGYLARGVCAVTQNFEYDILIGNDFLYGSPLILSLGTQVLLNARSFPFKTAHLSIFGTHPVAHFHTTARIEELDTRLHTDGELDTRLHTWGESDTRLHMSEDLDTRLHAIEQLDTDYTRSNSWIRDHTQSNSWIRNYTRLKKGMGQLQLRTGRCLLLLRLLSSLRTLTHLFRCSKVY